MIISSRGIVLHQLNYSESSIIAKIFSEEHGLQAFILKGARRKKSRSGVQALQPLALVEFSGWKKEKQGMGTLKEVTLETPYRQLTFDVHKSSVALFIAELLYKTIREEVADKDLFGFLHTALQVLDLTENPAHFHHLFMVKLSRYFGFYPSGRASSQTPLFDMNDGVFCASPPPHGNYLSAAEALVWDQLLGTNFDALNELKIPRIKRKVLLDQLILYFRVHMEGLGAMNSHEVLETVFSE